MEQQMEGASGGRGDSAAIDAFSRVVKPQEVLESLMNDGTFDALRGKVTAQLKSNEDLKRYTQSLVEGSQALNSPGAENKTRRELFDSLRRELEGPVLDRASKAAWELILSKDNLGKEIADAVDSTYSKLSSQAEAAPPPAAIAQAEMRTPSHEHQNAAENADKRTPSQERGEAIAGKVNGGYYSQPGSTSNGRDVREIHGNKRDRDQLEGSRDRDFGENWKDLDKTRSRDRDLYERRDAARDQWSGGGRLPHERDSQQAQDYARDSRDYGGGAGGSRDYFDNRRMQRS